MCYLALKHKTMNAAIKNIDLEPIVVKAIDKEEGLGWDLSFALLIAEEYKKFLYLTLIHGEEAIVPSKFVDEFWHLHILDTLKYFDDCDAVFGEYLHHFPYFGMRGEVDLLALKTAWSKTKDLYQESFGNIVEEVWNAPQRCPNCGVRCRSKRDGQSDERPTLSSLVQANG